MYFSTKVNVINKQAKRIVALLIVIAFALTGVWVLSTSATGTDNLYNQKGLGDSGSVETEKEPLPLGLSLPAPNDIKVTLSTASPVYRSFTDNALGTPPQDLSLDVFVVLSKSNILDGKVVLNPGISNGYLGSNKPYFIYSRHGDLAPDSIFSTVEQDANGHIVLYIKENQAANSTETLNLFFKFAEEDYNGHVPYNGVMMEPVAEAYSGSEKVSSFEGLKITTETKSSRATTIELFSPNKPLTGSTYEVFNQELVSVRLRVNNNYYYAHWLDYSYNNHTKLFFPVGTTFEGLSSYLKLDKGPNDLGVPVGEGEYDSVAPGRYFVLTYTWGGSQENPTAGWSTVHYGSNKTSLFTQVDLKWTYPTKNDGVEMPLTVVSSYKLASQVDPVNTEGTPAVYKVNNSLRWVFRANRSFGTGSYAIASTGLSNGDLSGNTIKTGYDYSHVQTSGNYGNVPVTGVKLSIKQGNDDSAPPKINWTTLNLVLGKGSKSATGASYIIDLDIRNALNGDTRVATSNEITSTWLQNNTTIPFYLGPLANLGPNEYIERINVSPLGTGGAIASKGTLPPFNSFSVQLSFGAWDDKKWPDGTTVGSHTLVPAYYEMEYNNEEGVSETPVTSSVYSARYQENGPYAIVQSAPLSTNAGAAGPEEDITYRLSGYNFKARGGAAPWIDPVIYVRMPAGIKLKSTSGIQAKDAEGATLDVQVTPLSQSDTYSYYKFQLSNHRVDLSDAASPRFIIDFTVRTSSGIATGDYGLDVVVSSNEASEFYMADPTLHNNNLPDGDTPLNYGLSTGDNYSNVKHSEFPHGVITIKPASKSTATSEIQSSTIFPDWSQFLEAPADFGDAVKMKLSIKNLGNIPFEKLYLYNIIPYSGYTTTEGYVSTGTPDFTGLTDIPEGAKTYYYTGTGLPPALLNIGSINLQSGDWVQATAPPPDAKAFYVDFQSATIAGGETLNIIMNFKVPPAASVSPPKLQVYNQFSFGYTSQNNTITALGESQGFTTHFYRVNYAPFDGDPLVTNRPPVVEGAFDTIDSVTINISSQVPTKPLHIFTGKWKDVHTGILYSSGQSVVLSMSPTPNRLLTLEPVFKKDPAYALVISYYTNGATSGDIVPPFTLAYPGETLTPPNTSGLKLPGKIPSGDFYTLPGQKQGEKFDFTQPLSPTSGLINLYVDWVDHSHAPFTLTFNVAGGHISSTPPQQQVKANTPVGILPGGNNGTGWGAPTREGYVFLGWATAPENHTPNFTSLSTLSQDTTVYAVWAAQNYTLTLDGNGGGQEEGYPKILSVQRGDSLGHSKMPIPPTREGHYFLGWATNLDAISPNFTASTTILDNLTVYGVWSKKAYTITVEEYFYKVGETPEQGVKGSSVTSTTISAGESYTHHPAQYPGYTLNKTVSDSLEITSITQDTVLRLYYQEVTYTVRYGEGSGKVELAVNDRNPFRDNSVSLRKLINLADISYTSSNEDGKRSVGKPIPKTVELTSDQYDDIDFSTITSGFDHLITVYLTWPSGQTVPVTLDIKISDTLLPEIILNDNQRYTFPLNSPPPSSEGELYQRLLSAGLEVKDNYDLYVEPEISYLVGGFSDINWGNSEAEYVLFLQAEDGSGNATEHKKAISLTFQAPSEANGSLSKNGKHYSPAQSEQQGQGNPLAGSPTAETLGTQKAIGSGFSSGQTNPNDLFSSESISSSSSLSSDSTTPFGLSEDEKSVSLGGRPTLPLPATGGGRLTLAMTVITVFTLIALLPFYPKKKKKRAKKPPRNKKY